MFLICISVFRTLLRKARSWPSYIHHTFSSSRAFGKVACWIKIFCFSYHKSDSWDQIRIYQKAKLANKLLHHFSKEKASHFLELGYLFNWPDLNWYIEFAEWSDEWWGKTGVARNMDGALSSICWKKIHSAYKGTLFLIEDYSIYKLS